MNCPQCGSRQVDDTGERPGLVRMAKCKTCEHIWEPDWDKPTEPAKPQPCFGLSPEYTAAVNLSPERLVTGRSPYPCPACGAVTGIKVSYQGRREEWECGCGHGWHMNATEEQPA